MGEPGLREFLRIYYGAVRMIDDFVGDVLAALDAAGRRDALVIFTTDHGDMAGHHGQIWKSGFNFFDELMRIPLIVRMPGIAPVAARCRCARTDLLPTILDACGIAPPPDIHGRSFLPALRGEPGAFRRRSPSASARTRRRRARAPASARARPRARCARPIGS